MFYFLLVVDGVCLFVLMWCFALFVFFDTVASGFTVIVFTFSAYLIALLSFACCCSWLFVCGGFGGCGLGVVVDVQILGLICLFLFCLLCL